MEMYLIVVACLIACIQALTNVGGVYRTSAVWNEAGSPYYVISNVGVPVNVSLTIEAGVQVVFDRSSNVKITIKDGSLTVMGSSEKPVSFFGGSANNGTSMLNFVASYLSNSSVTYARFIGPQLEMHKF